jgi:hypothetical protein
MGLELPQSIWAESLSVFIELMMPAVEALAAQG